MTYDPHMTSKEPWLAVILSSLLPGVGQIYAGKVLRGIICGLIAYGLLFVGGWILFNPTGSVLFGAQLLIGSFAFYILNLFDAHHCARKSNSSEFETLRKGDKDPWLGVFLSRIVPGLGHAVQRRWLEAVLWFVSTLAILMGLDYLATSLGSFITPLISTLLTGLGYTVWVCFCAYHLYQKTPVRREKSQPWLLGIFLSFVVFDLANVFLPWFLRDNIAEARYIPSGAMEPALQIHDRLIIDKVKYRFSSPQRGDLVVFYPTEILRSQGFKEAFIKRIIGLPGERVEIKQGSVYINGKRLAEPYLPAGSSTSIDLCIGSGIDGKDQIFLAKPVTILSKDSYLVLGDNRNNSYDGRCWGLINRKEIIGKATKRFWPMNRIGPI